MKPRYCIGLAMLAAALTWTWITLAADPPPPRPDAVSNPSLIPAGAADSNSDSGAPAGGEVLSQGPVHEAFANPIELDPKAGPIVKKQPPNPIKEIPPEQQPEGDNIVWIPGYWAWDDDRTDFIWVSGVYRAAPPGQAWVPGYWSQVNDGYQWTPGFWSTTSKQEVSYLPQPPASQEIGPSSPQPDENQFWVPGTYVYQNNDYYWRPGYWTVCRPNWIWVPAHYVWTPGGYVFVDGFWDYEFARRGCLFAPVYFAQPYYAVYTPSVVFNVGLFNDCLFVRPAFCHYYFGDYFAARYAGIGFSPWFSITIGNQRRCDPLFTYYRWHNSIRDRNWLAHTQQHFDELRRDQNLRPPHTFAALQQWQKNNPGAKGGDMVLASNLKDIAKDPSKSDFKFRNVSLQDRQALAIKGNELQQVTQQRIDIERKKNAPGLGGINLGSTTGSGSNSSKTGTTLNNNNSGNTGVAGGAKLKLPGAAASKMVLPESGKTNAGNVLSQNNNPNNNVFNKNSDYQNLGGQNSGGQRFKQNLNNTAVDKSGDNNPGDSGQNKYNLYNKQNNYGGSANNFGQSNNPSNPGANRTKLIQPDNDLTSGNDNSGKMFSGKGGNAAGVGNMYSGSSGMNSGDNGSPKLSVPQRSLIPNSGGNLGSGSGGGGGGNQGMKIGPSGSNQGKGSGGGGGGANKDKKKDTSYDKAPLPNTNYGPSKPSLVDVHDNEMETRKQIGTVTSLTGDPLHAKPGSVDADNKEHVRSLAHENMDDKQASDSDDSDKKPKKSYQLPPLFRKQQITSSTDARLRWLLGNQDDSTTSDQTEDDSSNYTPGNDSTQSRLTEKTPGPAAKNPQSTAKSTQPQKQTPQNNPALFKYDYQTLVERGRTLSSRTSYAPTPMTFPDASASMPGPTDMPNSPDTSLHGNKGPSLISGNAERRSMYGPEALSTGMNAQYTSGMPTGSAGAGGIQSGGSGSYISDNKLPTLQHFDTRLPTRGSIAPLPNPASRTYDPTRGY